MKMTNENVQNVSMSEEVQANEEQKFYMVRDADTKFTCTNYTFNKCGQGRGQRAKWFYSTYQGYPTGAYCMTKDTIQKQLRYLEYMNHYLGQNKRFEIFEVDIHNLDFSKNHKWEELTVTRYNTTRCVIQDEETGNYVSSDSVFITKDEILYCTHTGRADGLEYSNSYEVATRIANKIKTTLDKYHIHKDFNVIEVNKDDLPKGEMIIEHFSKKSAAVMVR